jgi:hypothetical protein
VGKNLNDRAFDMDLFRIAQAPHNNWMQLTCQSVTLHAKMKINQSATLARS